MEGLGVLPQGWCLHVQGRALQWGLRPQARGVDSSGPGLTPAPLPAFSLLIPSGRGCPRAPLLKPQDMQLMLDF